MTKELFWKKSIIQSKIAEKKGSLHPLKTRTSKLYTEDSHYFEIRHLLDKLPVNSAQVSPKINPFSPWDKNLEIDQIGDFHILILNKYPVQIGHMLLIRREWKPQNGWLDKDDFHSLLSVDQDTSGLWFFNSCPEAGASQPHRHMQLLRRTQDEIICPRNHWFESNLLNKVNINSKIYQSVVISRRIESNQNENHIDLYNQYLNLCSKAGLGNPNNNIKPTYPYNMLITRNWISIIRRRVEGIKGFSINGLGFAGYILSSSKSDILWLNRNGPEALLESVVDII